MAKILNLDKLPTKAPARELVLGGKTYPIPDMTVENFITTTRAAEKLLAESAGMADQVEATIDMILRSVPTLKREELSEYSLVELGQISAFVRGEEVEGAEEQAVDAAVSAEGASGNV